MKGARMRKRKARAKSRREATPEHIADRINEQRRRLNRASAVLGCLVFAARHQAEDIAFDDVAEVAQALIDQAIDGLDSTSL